MEIIILILRNLKNKIYIKAKLHKLFAEEIGHLQK